MLTNLFVFEINITTNEQEQKVNKVFSPAYFDVYI